MKIAIIAPSPVPFTIGGAENLFWGLLNHFNQSTSHQAELIKLPSFESGFWELIDSYRAFSRLNIDHFDLVLSTKYPAWMVNHPNHVCYMQHRLRGLYDTYHLTGLAKTFASKNQEIQSLQQFMKKNSGSRPSLEEFFNRLYSIKQRSNIPREAFQFPGALIYEIIRFLDGIGLSMHSIKKFAAISHNVSKRREYFPVDSSVEVIYHPSNLSYFRRLNADYILTVSRLDGPKRIDLVVQAMQYVHSDIKLKIVGTGPDEQKLKRMAKNDKRIEFLGFVNDEEIIDLYANALTVAYLPNDEDYGLITIEAMMRGKPVITSIDSGGPNEFVFNGKTGFSVSPYPKAIGESIDYLCKHRNEAREMGLNARNAVKEITWENTIRQLIGEKNLIRKTRRRKQRKKICVAVPFPVFPPRGGGQNRVFHLYRHMAREFDIELITIDHAGEKKFDEEIAPGLREIRIPKTPEHESAEKKISLQMGSLPVTDVTMVTLYHMTPLFVDTLKRSLKKADLVVASHPYLCKAIGEHTDKPILYEAHNVEVILKQNIFRGKKLGEQLIETTRNIEEQCCRASNYIFVCAKEDGSAFQEIYGTDPGKIIVVPNGVDLDTIIFVPPEKRMENKKRMGLEKSFTSLFMGSWHGPNLQALDHILKIASDLPEIRFLVVGSAGIAFQDKKIPSNVGLMGVVDDETKNLILSIADIAINPMESGSGTNLKMLEYAAAGIPILSTQYGARGISLRDDDHIEIVPIEKFTASIVDIRENWNERKKRVKNARNCVAGNYDWSIIARKFTNELSMLF